MTLADVIVVLQAGRIEQVGSPLHLYDDPDNQFVAGFIGSPRMNFLPGTVKSVAGGRAIIAVEGNEVSVELSRNPPRAGDSDIIGIRPEHLKLGGAGAQITVRPDVTEQMGGLGYLHSYSAQNVHVVAEIRGRVPQTSAESLVLSFYPTQAFVFDATGARLR